ncbi:DUF732 domain-containing protein [Nonomuraea recticatena]
MGVTGAHASAVPLPIKPGSAAISVHAVVDPSPDQEFLNRIHAAGIVAPDGQAVAVGRKLARLSASGASYTTLSEVVRDFGVYDHHVDAFIQAALAVY